MAVEKSDYEDTFYFGTVETRIISHETKNSSVTNSQFRVDYIEEYEAYGYRDHKDHLTSNQNGLNLVVKLEGEKPYHIHDSFDDGWFI